MRSLFKVFAEVMEKHLNVENYYVANAIVCNNINITLAQESVTYLNVYNSGRDKSS